MFGLSSGAFGGGSNIITGAGSVSGSPPYSPRFGNFDARGDLDVVAYWSLRNFGIGNKAMINEAGAKWQAADLELLKTLYQVQREVVDAHTRTLANFARINLREKAAGPERWRSSRICCASGPGKACPSKLSIACGC